VKLYIEVIQLSAETYFWFLKDGEKKVASSEKITEREVIIEEAELLTKELKLLPIVINERKRS